MKFNKRVICLAGLAGLACVLAAVGNAPAQERSFFVVPKGDAPTPALPPGPGGQVPQPSPVSACAGPITRVIDIGYEGVKTTTAVYGQNPGGGEGGQFDKTPVLSTKVELGENACLNAHLSAIVGSKQTYGHSPLTLFQVTLRRPPNPPKAIFGHYQTPYGHTPPSPAVALEAERDVDMFASNFFQHVGTGPNDVPPGAYEVDVWWAGAPPNAPGGAIGAAFVLKLYTW
jgi:hypothetical protein